MGIKFDVNKNKWLVSYSKRNPQTGKPVSLQRIADTKREASLLRTQLILEIEDRIKNESVPRWPKIIDGYLESCRKRSLTEKSIYNAEKCLKAATLKKWSNHRIDEITSDDIRGLINGDMADMSPSHRKGVLKFVRGAFAYACESGFVQRNPAPQIKFRCNEKIKAVLTEEQVRMLLERGLEYRWEWYYHVALAVYTGMRNGELYALTWDKVNIELRQIKVDCSWNNKDGLKSTKSGDDRIVEIAPPLVPMLRELRLVQRESDFVLPRLSRWSKGEQARELRTFLVGIGLPPIRFHDLRASWATIMLSRGVEPAKVMVMGGWRDLKTMMIYVRKAGINIRGITDQLNLHNPSPKMGKVLSLVGSNGAL